MARPAFPGNASLEQFLTEAYARRMKLAGDDSGSLDDLRAAGRARKFDKTTMAKKRDALADVGVRCIVSRVGAEFLNDLIDG